MMKDELNEILLQERNLYQDYMFPSKKRWFLAVLKSEPVVNIWKWQKLSRIVDYYYCRVHGKCSLFDRLMYLWYSYRYHKKSLDLGLEICSRNIGKGLMVYHHAGGIVVNGNSVIGENCHFHGNNCVGNAGPGDLSCPIIGDNVMLGVGAKIIGNVRVADNVKVAAGAVVVHDVLEEGCTVAGVPAKIVKHGSENGKA